MTPPPLPPAAAAGDAAFMAGLRQVKAWSGFSYRELERAAAAAGEFLPYSTAATMLRRDRLPRQALLIAYLAACGVDAGATRQWVAAHQERLTAAVTDSRPGHTPQVGRPRRVLRAVLGVATALAVLLGTGAAVASSSDSVEEEHVISTHRP